MAGRADVRELASDIRYRVEFETERGAVKDFVVQLKVMVDDTAYPVVRFDTAHGFAHCDRYDRRGVVRQHVTLPVRDFESPLTFAIGDILANWREYVAEFGDGHREDRQ